MNSSCEQRNDEEVESEFELYGGPLLPDCLVCLEKVLLSHAVDFGWSVVLTTLERRTFVIAFGTVKNLADLPFEVDG